MYRLDTHDKYDFSKFNFHNLLGEPDSWRILGWNPLLIPELKHICASPSYPRWCSSLNSKLHFFFSFFRYVGKIQSRFSCNVTLSNSQQEPRYHLMCYALRQNSWRLTPGFMAQSSEIWSSASIVRGKIFISVQGHKTKIVHIVRPGGSTCANGAWDQCLMIEGFTLNQTCRKVRFEAALVQN